MTLLLDVSVSEGVLSEISIGVSDSVAHPPLCGWASAHVEGLNRAKRPFLPAWFSWDILSPALDWGLHCWFLWFSGHQTRT